MADSPIAGPRRRGREQRSTLQGWSDLPDGPLHTILTCLRSFVDFTSFSAVCRSWRAMALSLPVTSLYPPLILRPTFSDHRRLSGLRLLDPSSPSFSSPLSRTFRKLEALHVPYFFHGHLLRFSQDRVVVLNPFTGHELVSPVVSKAPKMRYASVMLTSPPSSPDSTLLLFSYDTLFYWHIRSVDSSGWSSYCPTIKPVGGVRAATVQGKVYVMDCVDNLFVLDLAPELHLRPLAVERMAVSTLQCFLVDCGGELLHLTLVRTEKINWSRLEAFRLDFSEDRVRWVKKECLGNWAIFVGHDCRVPGLAVRNPERWGGKSNCVYVATENRNGDKPWAVIKLGDEINMYDPKSPLYNIKCWHQLSASWVHPGFSEMR